MSSGPQAAERELEADLALLGERFRDEEFCSDLYRALAGNALRREGAEARVSMSWNRAEELVNELRVRNDREPLTLAQTGGEGEISDLVAGALRELGWRAEPIDASRHDAERLTQPESAPPPEQGERMAPAEATDWERRAHAEAEEERRRAHRVEPPG